MSNFAKPSLRPLLTYGTETDSGQGIRPQSAGLQRLGNIKRGLQAGGPHADLGRGPLDCLGISGNKRAVPFSLLWHLAVLVPLCFTDMVYGYMIATALCTPGEF